MIDVDKAKQIYQEAFNQEISRIRSISNQYDGLRQSIYRHVPKGLRDVKDINLSSHQRLSQIANSLYRNSPEAGKAIDSLVRTIVGAKGIQVDPRPLSADGTEDKALASRIKMLWSNFLRRADVEGDNFAMLQRFACTHYLLDGDTFFHVINHRIPEAEVDFPFVLEMISSIQVPSITLENKQIFGGIEFNRWNYPKYYYFSKDRTAFTIDNCNKAKAQDIIHLRNRRKKEEVRGISILARAIDSIVDLKDYRSADRIAAKQEASLTFAITKNGEEGGFVPAALGGSIGSKKEIEAAAKEDAKKAEIERQKRIRREERSAEMTLSPGTMIMDLEHGEDIRAIDPPKGGTNIKTRIEVMIKEIVTAIGANYSNVANDYSGTYSAQRQELLDFWGVVEVFQNDFASQFVEKVYHKFIKTCIDYGFLTDIEGGLIDNAQYITPVMPSIDPLKDANANRVDNESGFKSKATIIQESGSDPEDEFNKMKEEEARGFGRPKRIADVQYNEEDETEKDEKNT